MAEIQDFLASDQEFVAKNKAFNERFLQQQKEINELLRKLKAQAPVRVDVQQPVLAEVVVKAEKIETERNDFVDLVQHESHQKALSD